MVKTNMNVAHLEKKAREIRLAALNATVASGKGHLGGVYSCTDLLVALYYGGVLRVDPSNPQWPDRDRFILSKGHACLALYAILTDLGFMPKDRLATYGEDGGLGGQLDTSIPGVDWNTGSLGHALGVCSGMALAAKLDGKDRAAYTILGDAECAEGSIWEALVFAGDRKLDNVVGIIDRNRLSVTGVLDDDSFYANFAEKLRLFGWDCFELNGHSIPDILATCEKARTSGKPVMMLAHTVKGKGVSFMENDLKWHQSIPRGEELAMARRELGDDGRDV